MADDQTVPDLARLSHQLRRREARRRGGPELTYRELVAKTGWSLGIIAQYFSGKTLPPFDRFDILVRLLGPVEAVGPGGVARLVGVRQRALVGLLALNAGRTVAHARLVDALWGEDPPRTAVQTLYSHVARVRGALDACGLRGVLHTGASGYLLAIRPEEVDAGRFEKRVAQARKAIADGTASEAVTHLQEGLALWRGDALADAALHGWAEADRLHEVPRTFRRICVAGLGLPTPIRPLRDADHGSEPRSRRPSRHSDHLEVREGARRYSADFFHTRSSTCASPSAVFKSSISSAIARSHGLSVIRPPSARPALPPSMNWFFHRPIDCSETLLRRAASTMLISPHITLSTMRSLSSTGNCGGRLMVNSFGQGRHNPDAKYSDARHADTSATEHHRGHGRRERRIIRTAPAAGIDFPHAAQVFQLRRDVGQLDEPCWRTKEIIYGITDLTPQQAGPPK